MSRRIEFSQFGSPEVLQLVDVEPPHPGPGEVRVKVAAVGINPYETKVFRNLPTSNPHTVVFPSGVGADFAGSIDELGEGVTGVALGDAVFGSRSFQAAADFLITKANAVSTIPEGLAIEKAGSLDTAGRTAWASTASLNLTPDDVVLVTAAAGGVGSIAVQLAKRAGATVIGSASTDNHDFLISLGVIPVEYGDGMVEAIRKVAPDGITAALDNFGGGSVEAALELGAPADRINTIDSLYPLERASEAYTRLLAGHLRGKIVLLT